MLTRRQFVQGIGGSTLLLGGARPSFSATSARELIGPHFDLTIDSLPVNLTGVARNGVVVNGSLPAPLLRMRQGDEVTIRVTNRLRERTSIHWHGFIVPADMDGVPGLSFDGIAPGSTFTYRFKVNQSRHVLVPLAFALPGAGGPVRPHRRRAARRRAPRARTASTCCCFRTGPITIRSTSTPRSSGRATTTTSASARSADFLADVREQGWRRGTRPNGACGARCAWIPRISPMSAGYAYTYLMNGTTPAGNWTGAVHTAASACACASSTARR